MLVLNVMKLSEGRLLFMKYPWMSTAAMEQDSVSPAKLRNINALRAMKGDEGWQRVHGILEYLPPPKAASSEDAGKQIDTDIAPDSGTAALGRGLSSESLPMAQP